MNSCHDFGRRGKGLMEGGGWCDQWHKDSLVEEQPNSEVLT